MIRPALTLLALLTGVTGVVYPVAVTAVAQLAFPSQANGSLITVEGRVVGSALIGQNVTDPRLFFGRPSANGHDAAASAASNLGPLNPALVEAVAQRAEKVRDIGPVPVDLVTASGSGLDPHLSPDAVLYQVPRVARARGVPEADLRALIHARTEGRTLGLLGEPRVNILELNLALEQKR